MTVAETRQKLLTDDAFVLSEIERVRYLYGLKKEIRWAQTRHVETDTESVAEHIYGMQVLANYFLPLEDAEGTLDKRKILEMITWHDMEEIETGDIVTNLKTHEHIKEAELALAVALGRIPQHLKAEVTTLMEEYEAQETPEAKFVKAIDKAEPLFEVTPENKSYLDFYVKNSENISKNWDHREKYFKNYPYILRVARIATDELRKNGFFPFLPEHA